MSFFAALPFLGSRLTTTMMQCLGVPVAIAIEWLWLGQKLSAAQGAWIAVILSGLVVALWPRGGEAPQRVPLLGIVRDAPFPSIDRVDAIENVHACRETRFDQRVRERAGVEVGSDGREHEYRLHRVSLSFGSWSDAFSSRFSSWSCCTSAGSGSPSPM